VAIGVGEAAVDMQAAGLFVAEARAEASTTCGVSAISKDHHGAPHDRARKAGHAIARR
jgi:hypothetical protein